jgi:hypothetical protein
VFSQLGTFQNIQLEVKYRNENAVSGILRHLANYDIPLDRNTETYQVNTHFMNGNNINRWFIAEFQLGFDPCVCDYFSELSFDLWGITKYDVSLTGRSISADLKLKDAGGDPIYEDFLNLNSVEDDPNTGEGGALIYRSLEGMLDAYDKNLEKYQQDINDYNEPSSKARRVLLASAKTGLKYALQVPIPEEVLSGFGSGLAGVLSNSSDKETLKKNGKYYSKEMSKATKAVLASMSDQLFVELVTKSDKPVKPSMPTATFTEMSINGEIDKTSVIDVNNLYTPGSFQIQAQGNPQIPQFEPNSYPLYNKPAGLFALLETPSLSVAHDTSFTVDPFASGLWYFDNHLIMKLKEPFKYKFNHAVDIDLNKTKIYVQYIAVMERDTSRLSNAQILRQHDFTKVSKTNMNIVEYVKDQNIDVDDIMLVTDYVPIEQMGELPFGIKYFDTLGPTIHSSVLYNRTLLKQIKLKLMVDMYFESPGFDGTEKNTTQVFTYLMYDKDQNIDYIEEKGEWLTDPSSISKYELGTLVLENEVIEPTDDFVTEVIGTDIYVNAEQIELKGNISVANGYKAKLQSYWGFEMNPTTQLTPEIELAIKRDFYNFPATTEVDDTELSAFCKGNTKKYQANAVLNKKEPDVVEDRVQAEEPIQFTLRPNPTFNRVEAIWQADESLTEVRVLNMMGQTIWSKPLEPNQSSVHLDLSNEAKGIYVVMILQGNKRKGQQKVVKL